MCHALSLLGARADFERARRGYLAARVGGLVTARRASRTHPRDLGDVEALSWHSARMRPIRLDAIVGTVDPTTDFDAGFRPAFGEALANACRHSGAGHIVVRVEGGDARFRSRSPTTAAASTSTRIGTRRTAPPGLAGDARARRPDRRQLDIRSDATGTTVRLEVART